MSRGAFRHVVSLVVAVLAFAALVPATARAQAVHRDDDDDEPSPRPQPPPFRPPRAAVWMSPLFPIVGPIAMSWVNWNSGVSVSLSRGVDLVLEGGLGYASSYSAPHDYTGGLSVGTSFFLTGSMPMNGLFVTPKVQFAFGPDQRGYSAAFLGFGFDVGFQFVRGPFFISPVIGILYNAEIPTSGFSSGPSYSTGINLAGVRLGVALDGRNGSQEARDRWARTVSDSERGLDVAHDTRPRSVAFWFLPAWIGLGPILYGNQPRYNFGLGATIPLVPRLQAVAQAGYEWGSRQGVSGTANYHAFQGAAGVSVIVTRSAPLNGLFFEGLLYASENVYGRTGGLASTLEAGVELNFGYQLTAGPIYFAPVIGFRIGGIAVLAPDRSTSSQQPSGVKPDVNLTLLRLGLAL